MKFRIIAATMIVLATIAVFRVGLGAQPKLQSQPTRSVLEGVYTDEQLKRGTTAFVEKCSQCHGHELSGGEIAPALFGANFMANWTGLTVGDLSERIRVSMPPANPESVSRQQNVDILSAILNANGFPAGQAELDTRMEMLRQIKIEPKK
jgi:hypothetical protein